MIKLKNLLVESLNKDLLNAIKSSKEFVQNKLEGKGILEPLSIKVKDFSDGGNTNWLALYRSNTQFRSKPIMWVNSKFIPMVKDAEKDAGEKLNPITVLGDTLLHEYGHIIWEFFHWGGHWEKNEINTEIEKIEKFIDETYNRDEEEFAEDFMKYMNNDVLSDSKFFDEVVSNFVRLAFN